MIAVNYWICGFSRKTVTLLNLTGLAESLFGSAQKFALFSFIIQTKFIQSIYHGNKNICPRLRSLHQCLLDQFHLLEFCERIYNESINLFLWATVAAVVENSSHIDKIDDQMSDCPAWAIKNVYNVNKPKSPKRLLRKAKYCTIMTSNEEFQPIA